MMEIVILGLALFIILFLYLNLLEKYRRIKSKKQSLSTKYGQITEQFLPFMKHYPYDQKNFRFIGNPIDGIQFEEDKIIFLEFKTNKSKLSKKQKHIKHLINNNKVEFKEMRLNGTNSS